MKVEISCEKVHVFFLLIYIYELLLVFKRTMVNQSEQRAGPVTPFICTTLGNTLHSAFPTSMNYKLVHVSRESNILFSSALLMSP